MNFSEIRIVLVAMFLEQLPTGDNSPVGEKIKPNYCPPGPLSVGQVPTRTTPHQDHYQPVKPLIRTTRPIPAQWGIVLVGTCPDTGCNIMGNSTVTELQIRYFGLLFNHFVPYSYDLSQFEYFYKVQRYPCHHLKHKICQSSLLFRDQRGICESVTELPEN